MTIARFACVCLLLSVTFLSATARAGVALYGDADVLGTGTYSSDPTIGATLEGLATDQVTAGTLIQSHSFPFSPEGNDYPGTDQIYVGSNQTGYHDGYSNYSGRMAGPQIISLNYSSLVPQDHRILTLTLGMAGDDFQYPHWGQPFNAWVNNVYNSVLTNVLRSPDQTGPKVQFFTIGINPSILTPNHTLTVKIDEAGDGGDGWAADFLTVGVTTQHRATIGLSSPVNGTIITGGSTNLGTTVTNTAPTGSANLSYGLTRAVTQGAVTLGPALPSATGNLAPGAWQQHTVSATSTNVGPNTVTFTCTDAQATNSPQDIDATLTVLDHSQASFSPTTTQTLLSLDLGRRLRSAMITGQGFGITNRAVGNSPQYTAGLDLDSFTPNDSNPLKTNLATFSNHPAGQTDSFSARMETGTSGDFSKTVTIGLSDQDLSGGGAPDSQTLTLRLSGTVGNARADGSGSTKFFGPALDAIVLRPGPYAGLESTVVDAYGAGGLPMVGSTARLLGGGNTTGLDLGASMAWRTRAGDEAALVSDVVRLAGMANGGPGPFPDEHGQTDVFVLQLNYGELLLPGDERDLASKGLLQIGWLDPADGRWKNAIAGDFGPNVGQQNVQDKWTGQLELGAWGVDIERNTVWAVLNHNSDLAVVVVPEPPALALLAASAVCGLAFAWRKRRH
jgi:hypothetical protein